MPLQLRLFLKTLICDVFLILIMTIAFVWPGGCHASLSVAQSSYRGAFAAGGLVLHQLSVIKDAGERKELRENAEWTFKTRSPSPMPVLVQTVREALDVHYLESQHWLWMPEYRDRSGIGTATRHSRSLFVPLWPFVVALLPVNVLAWRRYRTGKSIMRCDRCGYDTSYSNHICPECGEPIPRAQNGEEKDEEKVLGTNVLR